MATTLTDMELMDEIRSGNTAAFRTFYYRHVDRIFGLTTRILGPNRPDREDVVQEIFFQAYRAVDRFKGDSSVGTWLYRIAANVSYSALRRPGRTVFPPLESAGPTVSEEGRVDARRTVRRMYELLESLSHRNRMVFTLYEFEGLTLDRIAEVLEIPLHTAASRLRRSREQIVQGLGGASSLTQEQET